MVKFKNTSIKIKDRANAVYYFMCRKVALCFTEVHILHFTQCDKNDWGGGEGVRNDDVCAEGNEHNCDIYVPFYIKINFS